MNFYKLLEDFILVYIPTERGYSINTAKSYYTTIKQFINYQIKSNNTKQSAVSVYNFSRETVIKFLLSGEEKGNSAATRNQKLIALKTFLYYCSLIDPIYQNTFNQIQKIKMKKEEKRKLDFLTIDEYKTYVECIDLHTKNGIRHYTMINLLYDTATRVSELINIKVEDIHTGTNNSIRIFGKGKKYRLVYISEQTIKLLNDYLKKFNIHEGYLFRNNKNEKLSRFGINHIINKYYRIACEKSNTIKQKNVTPHTFRHTKACHFLLNGTALPIIQRFLGHSSIQTTEIYLDLTSDVIIKAVDEASKLITENLNIESIDKKWEDEEIMRKLKLIFSNQD